MAALIVLLLAATPVHETFDAPLDPARWYLGTGRAPNRGALRLEKGAWIVARGIPDAGPRRIEIDFRSRGGIFALTFHREREPLSSPLGATLRVARRRKGKGPRTLVLERGRTLLDGVPVARAEAWSGTFRLEAERGEVEISEIRIEPRVAEPPEPTALERANVHFLTTPPLFRERDKTYTRRTILLWDVEVTLLVARGEPGCRALVAPVRGAPVLGALVVCGDGKRLAAKAGGHPVALRDWRDEKRNLDKGRFRDYLASEYAVFGVLESAQRAMNLAVEGRDDLEPMVALAVLRHSPNAHAAYALAETRGAKRALVLVREALGKRTDPARAPADRLRAAAAQAARKLLGDSPPRAWTGFRFDPTNRFVTMEQAREFVR